MDSINWLAVLKVVCKTVIAAPLLLAAVTGLTLTPVMLAIMALAAFAAAQALGEMQPGNGEPRPLSDADIDRLAKRGLELMQR